MCAFNFTRARLTCERTVDSDVPNAFATSAVESPSKSRSTIAARSFAGNRRRPASIAFHASLLSAARSGRSPAAA